MDHSFVRVIFSYFVVMFIGSMSNVIAQSSYKIHPTPSLWYNSVDGLRIGVHVRGEVEGTFSDGPHRLALGFWLGSKWADQPWSYYASLTEPISQWSDFASEASIQFRSQSRVGHYYHGIGFNKRWQRGFDESVFSQLSIQIGVEKWITSTYLIIPVSIGASQQRVLDVSFSRNTRFAGKPFAFDFSANSGIVSNNVYLQPILTFQYRVIESRHQKLAVKLGASASIGNVPQVYGLSTSLQSVRNMMHQPLFRARGTLPVSALQDGWLSSSGTIGLRGYQQMDAQTWLQDSEQVFTRSAFWLNTEYSIESVLSRGFKSIPFLGDIVSFSHYLFYDMGYVEYTSWNFRANAGPGFKFSLQLPTLEGGINRLILRYELPFWVHNDTLSNNDVSFRHRLTFGAIFNF